MIEKKGGEFMELAQAVDNTIPNTPNVTTALGITPEMIFWSVLIVVAIALVVWAAARYAERNRYTERGTIQGAKGGRIKRTITEYEEPVDDRV